MVVQELHQADIVAIIETWCNKNILDRPCAVSLNSFDVYRSDRQDGSQHGGMICCL